MQQLIRWGGFSLVVVGAVALLAAISLSPEPPAAPIAPQPPQVAPIAPEPPVPPIAPEPPAPPIAPVRATARVINTRDLAAMVFVLVGAYLIWGKSGQVASSKEQLAR